jgi:REP element-mobilizing transposase RayT
MKMRSKKRIFPALPGRNPFVRNFIVCIVLYLAKEGAGDMAIARKKTVRQNRESIYHCTARCVRRAFLCGSDSYSSKNYDHRRLWIKDRLILLSQVFAHDILGYAVMSNHLHVIFRTRPDVATEWPPEEVARRWLLLHPPRDPIDDSPRMINMSDIKRIVCNSARIVVLRSRLENVSWFMRHLSEPISRQANQEDGCKGRFWEGRFKCREILDEAALLATLVYVDLNPIRSGLARTPEESEFTGAGDRICARKAVDRLNQHKSVELPYPESGLNSESQGSMAEESDELRKELASAEWLCPWTNTARRRGVFKRLSLEEYLVVLDETGRLLASGKRGYISPELAPILERLSINGDHWPETVSDYDSLFGRLVGIQGALRAGAGETGPSYFRGVRACRKAFGSGHPDPIS